MVYDIDGNPLSSGGKFDGVFPVLDPNQILTVTNPSQMYSTFATVYDAYDSILASVQHEKNLLGYGTDSSGAEDMNLPIYEYVLLNPIEPNYPTNPEMAIEPAPKVCITSGLHGDERGAVVALMNLIRMIVSGTDSVSMALRQAVQYHIVPVANPGGYNDYTRDNRHGVNINRNFGYNWTGTAEHAGSSAYSEYETQALKAWVEEQSPTTLFAIDCHNHLASQTDNIFYMFTSVHRWMDAFSTVVRGMVNHYAAESIDLTDYVYWTYNTTVAGLANEFWKLNGVESGGIETPYDHTNPSSNIWVKPSAELQGTFIRYMLNNVIYKSA